MRTLLPLALTGLCTIVTSTAICAGDYPTKALFGDTHVHTGWSGDAGMDGAVLDPFQAYQFALGQEVQSNSGIPAKLQRPYDWFMITDHSDGMGTINQIVDENPEMMADPTLKRWSKAIREGGESAASAKSELIRMQSNGELPSQIMDPKWMVTAWEKTIEAAEQFYKPGEFTTFIAYEWTVNSDGGDNLHRNVIFRDDGAHARQVLPLTTFETQDPAKLWAWMEGYEKKTGGQVLAIPHNGNMSNGRMFEEQQFDGSPMTKEWAAMRARYEPLYEVTQIKGQSESHPSLSPDDEFAAWDLWDRGNLILKPKPPGSYPAEYWRPALQAGLRIEKELGVNPFQYGANGGTDTHTGLSTTEEDNFFGKFKTLEPRKDRWSFPLLEGESDNYVGWEMAASGTMGVWATENTREAIWDAMMRRETFATTGPRMSLRFFAGYDFSASDLDADLARAGYDRGVPMGAELSADGKGRAPTFLLAAMRDPEGANLDRIQVVKGWVDKAGQTHEKIHDVVWSGGRKPGPDGKLPAVGDTVDRKTATYRNDIGAADLVAVWTDPDFDAGQPAVYYLRVLQIPTPRWTLYDQVRFGSKLPDTVETIHQERGFSSPIWYKPAG